MDSIHEQRTRNLTPGGETLFLSRVEDFCKSLSKQGERINGLISQTMTSMEEGLIDELAKSRTVYLDISNQFIDFLHRTRTMDSARELSAHGLIRESFLSKIDLALEATQKYVPPKIEHEESKSPNAGHKTPCHSSKASSCSSQSSRSHKSSASYILTKQRLKHERAKVQLEFMKKEAQVLKQQAEVDVSLKLLRSERNLKEAEAELDAVHDLIEEENGSVDYDIRSTKKERTAAFVNSAIDHVGREVMQPSPTPGVLQQPSLSPGVLQQPSLSPGMLQQPSPAPGMLQQPSLAHGMLQQPSLLPGMLQQPSLSPGVLQQPSLSPGMLQQPSPAPGMLQQPSLLPGMLQQPSPAPGMLQQPSLLPGMLQQPSSSPGMLQPTNSPACGMLRPEATEFQPTCRDTNELTKFLMKRDLLLSRFTQFSDEPQRYTLWKNSFKNLIRELEVTATEELDLLIRWLGPESTQQALSLRAAHTHDERLAITRIWERLDSRYGAPELVIHSFKKRLEVLPKLTYKDNVKMYELSDLLIEMQALKENVMYTTSLAYLDSSAGINPIVAKLPAFIQRKWTDTAFRYKKDQGVLYPPFNIFTGFMKGMTERLNDPGLQFDTQQSTQVKAQVNSVGKRTGNRMMLSAKKTDVEKPVPPAHICPIHGGSARHSLKDCRLFLAKTVLERKEVLKKNGYCFKCCEDKHLAKTCKVAVKCDICGGSRHPTILHEQFLSEKSPPVHGGECSPSSPPGREPNYLQASSSCTQVCKDSRGFSKSCAKTILVKVYPKGEPDKSIRLYAIIDDQSNMSLARTAFFDSFGENSQYTEYTMASCSGLNSSSGRKAQGYVVESMDGDFALDLPVLLECDNIPNNRNEIPTPEAAHFHSHLRDISQHLRPLDRNADILMLIGRDMPAAHHIIDQRIGPSDGPYAQRLKLGWVVVGEVCLGKVHQTSYITANKVHTLANGRPSLFEPCPNCFDFKEDIPKTDNFPLFVKNPHDDKPGLSLEDKEFLHVMDTGFRKNDHGQWEAPLPLKTDRPRLPDNRAQSLRRARTLDTSLRRDSQKCSHMMEFMSKVLDKGHAEVASDLDDEEERWYLPLFGIYHPKKPDKIRCVFDSSAKENGLSLNSVLMTGPDLTNSLLGVLLRFRKDPIAIMADVEQMFYCFKVVQEHRNFLRFFWYADNSIAKPLIEYRMTAHVFGNSPSPAVATYGLRKAAENSDEDIRNFVTQNFYVDDGLASAPNVTTAVSLIKRTQRCLQENGGIRLHKVASNSREVLETFDREDLAGDIRDLDLSTDCPPVQRSLGLLWNLASDSFIFSAGVTEKAYTKRGLLSTINGIYDPIGFAAPVILRGRLLFRDLVKLSSEWDEPLPEERRREWESWYSSLGQLRTCSIPRQYVIGTVYEDLEKEVHIFSDASKDAVAAVAYLRTKDTNNQIGTSFIFGKAKVAPQHGHTIPRLELCAAVLATDLGRTINDQLDIPAENMHFYSDSMVVLGYLHNRVRRFYVYVGNRVDRILGFTKASQWSHVSSEKNPADEGTRCVNACDLQESMWLQGSSVLREDTDLETPGYPLVQPGKDVEVRQEVKVLKTSCAAPQGIGAERVKRFSTWNSLVRGIANLKSLAIASKNRSTTHTRRVTTDLLEKSRIFILQDVQQQVYSEELQCLRESKTLPSKSSISALTPILDQDGILRVGGRLNRSNFPLEDRNPIIVPGKHHVARLIIEHFHSVVRHQGRHLTEGAVRSAGYWVTGAKRLISSILHACVTCCRLRRKPSHQQMADLPPDRLEPCAPFTYVGVDVFGPWNITTRRTRGGVSQSKRWAVLFTCLVSRAAHIEVIEEMSSSSFINALRRFISIRGPVREFRSDNGTNFVGCTQDMGFQTISVDEPKLANFLLENSTVWRFNPPHASHMGGVWERMIGTARRILDSMLLDMKGRTLTHEILTTLMAEVTAIMNSRPITPVSTDPQDPSVLSPSALLTQKTSNSSVSCEHLSQKDLYRHQWKCVQVLAEEFWKKWRREYLVNLQSRNKWQQQQRNLKEGDIVLMRDRSVARMEWPLGIINRVFKSDDELVRKVEIRIVRDNKISYFVRPVTEVVFLTSSD
ncbi:uncharacterized protein LOC117322392 [Pecten maximus]|uniref:uncharacterized protein LOC117322392 n=1 Tax=Pecten maximus TaxID=6579 RepID=UPI00145851AA|nr:uncharacterized protein LOC117322392 [Pecten maximus]